MNGKNLIERLKPIGEKLKKFRYPALVLLLGIGLMLVPLRKQKSSKTTTAVPTQSQSMPDYKTQVEQQLCTTLGKMQGVGRVSVMLSLRTGTETIYQTDSSISSQSGENRSDTAQEATVIVSRGSGGEEAVVRKTILPGFQGALIVCEGADDPSVKLNVINAVSGLTGLSSEKITVVKMK
ncbi:MAG: hypothetical protein MJ085_04145 [Clostridia bacterium]|nr:hypothetical protein [Clostridia bacterium]